MQRPWPLVKGNGFILVSECLPGIISVPLPGNFVSQGFTLNDGHSYVTAVAVGQSQRLYSGVRMFTGNYFSFL
jgi:hypothetical protein